MGQVLGSSPCPGMEQKNGFQYLQVPAKCGKTWYNPVFLSTTVFCFWFVAAIPNLGQHRDWPFSMGAELFLVFFFFTVLDFFLGFVPLQFLHGFLQFFHGFLQFFHGFLQCFHSFLQLFHGFLQFSMVFFNFPLFSASFPWCSSIFHCFLQFFHCFLQFFHGFP